LLTGRGVAEPTESALDRLRRTVIEASKQCGRNRLMEIASPIAARDLFISAPGLRLLADPGGQSMTTVPFDGGKTVMAAVGPERGLTDDELKAAAAAGWQRVSLGRSILRVETAAIAIAAWAATSRV